MVLDPGSRILQAPFRGSGLGRRRAAPRKERLSPMDGDTLLARAGPGAGDRGPAAFLSPGGWRRVFERVTRMSDGQLRFFGLCSILAGWRCCCCFCG